MLNKVLDGNILIMDSIENWEEAVRAASKKLLEKKYIKDEYVEAMIADINRLGFYIVLNEGVVVGKGTHDELMDNCEVYREIAFSQLSKEELNHE